MQLEYLIVRVLLNYDQEGNRNLYAVRGDARKLGHLSTWTSGTLDQLLDELGQLRWELTAGTTAFSATVTDVHLVLKRPVASDTTGQTFS